MLYEVITYIHYAINSNYYTAKSITELSTEKPLHQNQIVFLEIPALCDTTFPARLLQSIDFPIMAARANRAWSSADKNLISQIIENFKNPMQVILNGVDLDEMESILNEVPKRRSKFRRYRITSYNVCYTKLLRKVIYTKWPMYIFLGTSTRMNFRLI